MNTLKLRAECSNDILSFINILPNATDITLLAVGPLDGNKEFPDMEMVFSSPKFGLNQIKQFLKSLKDCHVMAETVARVEDYTGIRDCGQGNRKKVFSGYELPMNKEGLQEVNIETKAGKFRITPTDDNKGLKVSLVSNLGIDQISITPKSGNIVELR